MSDQGPPTGSGDGRDPRLEIPEVLRRPVEHPSLKPKEPAFAGLSAAGDIGKALAIGLDFLFVGAAAAVLGWLADRWLGSSPIGLLVGLTAGFFAGTFRLIQRLNREDLPKGAGEADRSGGKRTR